METLLKVMNDKDKDDPPAREAVDPSPPPETCSRLPKPADGAAGGPDVSEVDGDADEGGAGAATCTGVVKICPTCKQLVRNTTIAARAALSNNKRKEAGVAVGCSRPISKKQAVPDRSKPRARLTLGQKLEILELLDDKNMTRVEIAAIYKCSDRTVSSCSVNRDTLKADAASSARKLKSKGRRPAGFPNVDSGVLALIKALRINQIPVSRTTIASLGHAVKASLLATDETPPEDKSKLEKFGASEKWVKNFVSRNGLVSKPLLLAGGGMVDHERVKKEMKEVQEKHKEYDLTNIRFEDGALKRSYLSPSEAENLQLAEANEDGSLGA